ncbi:MAG: 7TM diverse intracellular signaling domain-containing protein [Bacteroidota bacterium]|nr:7TM diverse intracellular signaling domain-containing protein [Bacteroidota bacterium]
MLKIKRIIIGFLLSATVVFSAFAQTPVSIGDIQTQHIFGFKEIEYLEDPKGIYTFDEVKLKLSHKFRASEISTPRNDHLSSYYWYRIAIDQTPRTGKNWILEFYDQTIDDIVVYRPDQQNNYSTILLGDKYRFGNRVYLHKNFIIDLDNNVTGIKVYYIRLKSHQSANVILVLRSINWFIHYALDEYFFFGLFYGMVLVFSFYNFIMYLAVRQRQYLYYILYNLSIGLYEMCTDGIAFHYLWPNWTWFNQFAFGVALYLASIFAIFFTLDFLHVKAKYRTMNRVIYWWLILRSVYFAYCLFVDVEYFNYKFIDLATAILAFYTGVRILQKGYRPARFFVIGYGFLVFGIILKILIVFNVPGLPYGPVTHYSLSFCFVLEMILVSFAIGEKVRILKMQREFVQKRTINEMRENAHLKDVLNRELESQVQERTKEIVEKSEIIEIQNKELLSVNSILKDQAEEIIQINELLKLHNIELQSNVDSVTRARVMSAEVNFEEFSKIYPDDNSCFKFLSELKWEKGYTCRKCNNSNYFQGHLPYSRRCTKCGYEESVIANTIFQNTRIPINKAFYLIFLVYSSKGKISSHKLSEILGIRQSTCWTYASKIKKVMDERKNLLKNAGDKGWSKLVLGDFSGDKK